MAETSREHAIARLALLAADTGPLTGHSQIGPHEAKAILVEIVRLRSIVRIGLLRHVPGATNTSIDALLDGGPADG